MAKVSVLSITQVVFLILLFFKFSILTHHIFVFFVEKCDRDIDLGFIIDSSGSLKADYQEEKNFVKALVNNFE